MLTKTLTQNPLARNGHNGKIKSVESRAFVVSFIPQDKQLNTNILLLWAEALTQARRDITRATSEIHRMLGQGEIDAAGLLEILSALDKHNCNTLADELMALASLATMGSELNGVTK